MSKIKRRGDPVATTAGAGAGTGLIGLANLFPEQYVFAKACAVYLAPTATVVVRWAWIFFRAEGFHYVKKWKLHRACKAARKIRDRAVVDPNCTLAHRTAAVENFEIVEKILMKLNEQDATEAWKAASEF